jgi:predicted ATPase
LTRSALVEAVEQLKLALTQIASLPSTPALRREEIKFQIALINPLIHIKGYGAPETKAAAERARLLMEQAEALGEPAEDPLLLFSVLYGIWVATLQISNADVARALAAQLLALAERQESTGPLMIGTSVMGTSLLRLGEFAQARAHHNKALALYDPAEHRPLATRFGQDMRVTILVVRSLDLWFLGYPDAALADADQALKDAREIGQATSLMFALGTPLAMLVGNYATAMKHCDELIALANEKGALYWKAIGLLNRGNALALSGKASDALETMVPGINAWRSTGATIWMPLWLSHLARSYAVLGQFDDARRCISEAMKAIETTKEKFYEAEVSRIAGQIVLKSPVPDVLIAEEYFERALAIARKQQAKSLELRAAMSLARLWRDQGKVQQARELLAPVYGWFTEGFDTRDLKEAKALLNELRI